MVTKIEQTDKEAIMQAGRDYIAKVSNRNPINVLAGLGTLMTTYIQALEAVGHNKSDILNTLIKVLTKTVNCGENDDANNPS